MYTYFFLVLVEQFGSVGVWVLVVQRFVSTSGDLIPSVEVPSEVRHRQLIRQRLIHLPPHLVLGKLRLVVVRNHMHHLRATTLQHRTFG